jgi:serralysin
MNRPPWIIVWLLAAALIYSSFARAGDIKPCCAIDLDLERPKHRVTKNGIEPLSLWGKQPKFWSQVAFLRVRFLDGSKGQQDRAWKQFQKVDALVNLTFVRVTAGESECRVSFRYQGHWSYIGRDNLSIPKTQPTMNLQLTVWDTETEWQRVGCHEVFHFIGFGHELQHPMAKIPWNVPVVLSDYRRDQGWSEAMTRRQVLTRESPADFVGSDFDPKSIQCYPVSARHVTDPRFAVGWNTQFSPTDIATASRIYPRPVHSSVSTRDGAGGHLLQRGEKSGFIDDTYEQASFSTIARKHVLDARYAVGWNDRLSPLDVATLKRLYPPLQTNAQHP